MREFSKEDINRIMNEELEVFEKKGLLINPNERAVELRPMIFQNGKYLVSDFTGSKQLADIKKRTDSLIDKKIFDETGETKLLYRSKIWIKPLDPTERKRAGLPPLDLTDLDALEALTRDDKNFDANLWSGDISELRKYNLPFLLQLLSCNLHGPKDMLGCYFCFVDRYNNCPELREDRGAWINEQNVVDSFEAARSNQEWIKANNLGWIAERGGLNHIRVSGGQTTEALDLVLNISNELKRRGLPVKVMYDTNLSTAEALKKWMKNGVYPKDILKQLGKHKVSLLTAFKGTDDMSIQYNTQSTLTLEQQFDELKMHVNAGEFCYIYSYNPNPYSLNDLIDQGMDKLNNFLPMLHLATIGMYGPTEDHMRLRARVLEKNEEEYIALQKELTPFLHAKSAELLNARCEKELGVPYRMTSRRTITQEMGGLQVR